MSGINMPKVGPGECVLPGVDTGGTGERSTTDLCPTQLTDLCQALGWQGGTYHQVLAEVKRLKARDTAHRAEMRQAERDAMEDARGAATEAYWQAKQEAAGDYGSY